MANFTPAIEKTFKHEGGYVNIASDLGGETYRGISRRYNPNWEGWAILDAYKKDFPNGIIKRYTIFPNPALDAMVRSYYKRKFWDAIKGDEIKNQAVAELLFDAKMGQTGGFGFMVSNALHESGNKKFPFYTTPKQGVKYTLDTLSAINFTEPKSFFDNFKKEREQYFKLRGSKPGQEVNLNGWLNRLSTYDYQGYFKNNAVIIALFFLLVLGVGLYVANKKGWIRL